MTTINVEMGDILIVDPCYIKNAGTEWGGKFEPRFDLLRCKRVRHDGDDGCFPVRHNGETRYLGVDSGRIWEMVAEFGGTVELSAGMSDYWLIKKGE